MLLKILNCSLLFIFFLNPYLFSDKITFLDVKFPKDISYPKSTSKCLNCHKNISIINKDHNFKCVFCHNGNNEVNDKLSAHKDVIKNPSNLKYVKLKCGKCHEDDIMRVKKSLMATNKGIINITRYLWKAQKSPYDNYTVYNMPDKELVDDFLRKVCLRCHVNREGSKRFGEIRSSGCAACHVPYKNNGEHLHIFTREIDTAQCLHCHNFNRVGMDYVGYFEHDYSRTYRSPITKNGFPPKIYGIYQHRLQEDIHFAKNFKCTDCHNKEEVMGDGKEYSFKYEQVKIRCVNCHKNYNKNTISHKLHKNLECFTCHSSWGFQDYGLNALREDFKGYFKWKFLKDINIPDTQKILYKSLGNYGDLSKLNYKKDNFSKKLLPPLSRDYILNKKKLGVWYIGWIFRRWSDPVLGINERGKISPVRPDYQFYVSYVNKDYKIILNNEKMRFNWSPYVPHTTSKYGRSCFSCHNSTKALGLGYGLYNKNGTVFNIFEPEKDGFKINFPIEKITNLHGDILQPFIYPGSSPLKSSILKKILFKFNNSLKNK
jgi:hypothetical protein